MSYYQFFPQRNLLEIPSHSKSQRRASAESKEKRKKPNKLIYSLREDVYCISPAQPERAKNYVNRIKELKYLLYISQFSDKDVEVPQNFPTALFAVRLATDKTTVFG